MAKKKSNTQLAILLALIVAVVALIVLLPSCGNRSSQQQTAPETTEKQEEKDDTAATTLVKVGDVAPDFTVTMFDGSTVSLKELRGKVVLLNFWATWCPPCRKELTHVQSDIIDRFAGRDFAFLPISRAEKREDVAAFREKMGYTFPMGLDPERAIYDLYASNYIPRNFLIDADGKVLAATVGFEEAEFAELIQQIEKALNK